MGVVEQPISQIILLKHHSCITSEARIMGSILSSDGTTGPSPFSTSTVSNPSSANLVRNIFSIVSSSLGNDHKMIFVVNMDLNMGRGEQCAQVAHAALGLYLKNQQDGRQNEQNNKLMQWISFGQKKIVVKGDNLTHLETIQAKASEANLANILISHDGSTQVAPGSKTVLAIFGSNQDLESITGSLKLL